MKVKFSKTVSLPPQHIGLNFIDRVPPRSSQQSADRLPARPSVNLGGSTNMEPGSGLQFHLPAEPMVDCSTTNSKQGFAVETLKTLLEIVGREIQIRIQFDNEIPALNA